MVWPNLALVLPISLPLPSSRAFPSSCIINKPLILVLYKLGKLRKCWRFLSLSYPLPFVAAVDHPPLQKKSSAFPRAVYTRNIHVASLNVTRACGATSVLLTRLPYCRAYCWGKALYFRYVSHRTKPYRCAYYDRSMTTVREQTFDGYCTVCKWYRSQIL